MSSSSNIPCDLFPEDLTLVNLSAISALEGPRWRIVPLREIRTIESYTLEREIYRFPGTADQLSQGVNEVTCELTNILLRFAAPMRATVIGQTV